jgi:signal transduction histidine kinase
MHAVVTTEREVSVPFAPPTPVPDRHVAHAESSALQRQLATRLQQRAEDVAARWAEQIGDWLPGAAMVPANDTSSSSHDARTLRAAALVRSLAAALAGDASSDDAAELGRTVGVASFATGAPLHDVLRGIDLLAAMCLHVVEEGVASDDARNSGPVEVVRACRQLQAGAAAVTIAVARGHAEAADSALQERFRRLRHDLRNPLSTIRSALSLMADETVPEVARQSPRFRAMIERNTAMLDQMIVARLSDLEAHLVPLRDGEMSSAPFGVGESGDDFARPRQREDRQAGSF